MINKAINKENTMLCYQCGETADVTGCTARGACGKTDDIAGLKDELLAETEKLAFVAIWLRDEGKATGILTNSFRRHWLICMNADFRQQSCLN